MDMETTVKRIVEKPQRIALCRRCGGTGRLGQSRNSALYTPQSVRGAHPKIEAELSGGTQLTFCPQCGGSGRVLVSCKMELDIRPYSRNDIQLD